MPTILIRYLAHKARAEDHGTPAERVVYAGLVTVTKGSVRVPPPLFVAPHDASSAVAVDEPEADGSFVATLDVAAFVTRLLTQRPLMCGGGGRRRDQCVRQKPCTRYLRGVCVLFARRYYCTCILSV